MKKYLLNICLLASITNVSAASLTDEPTSPFGHHERGGAATRLPGAVSSDLLGQTTLFPAAIKVTWEGIDSTIAVSPTMRVEDFRASLIVALQLRGGHSFKLKEGTEIMTATVGVDGKLITLPDVFSGYSGIVEIIIEPNGERSPLQSKTSTPAPQAAGETSPATGDESQPQSL